MTQIPIYVPIIFIITTIATFGFTYFFTHVTQEIKGGKLPLKVSAVILTWLLFTAILALNDFFMVFDSMPPRLVLAIGVPFISIIILFANTKSRAFIKRIPITALTYLHIIRVPVEIVLWWLFIAGLVPQLMTFEGGNYDIFSGISAPFVAIFLVGMKSKKRVAAIIWNLITLFLLFNIVFHAILSTPLPFQQFAFDSPNLGIFKFPFIWLPAFIVPTVLFAHLASLLKLVTNTEDVR